MTPIPLPTSASNTLDSEAAYDRFGFSTGALERGDFRAAADWMVRYGMKSIELSALRYAELEPLVKSLDGLPLDRFNYVSFHAPSSFDPHQESRVLELLQTIYHRRWNIIVHPDVIYTPERWDYFGSQLLIENMDRRKPIGRTVDELLILFKWLPQARLCLDVAHARQQDTTLTLLNQIIRQFVSKIAEVHISELDSHCQHWPMSLSAVYDYNHFAVLLRNCPHVIIESMLDAGKSKLRMDEWQLAQWAMVPEKACWPTIDRGW